MGNLTSIRSYDKKKSITLADFYGDEARGNSKGIDLSAVINEGFRVSIYEYLLYKAKKQKLKQETFISGYYNKWRKLIHSGQIDNLSQLSDIRLENWERVYSINGAKRFHRGLSLYLEQKDNRNKGSESDIWYLDEFKIDEKRNNPSRRVTFLRFNGIKCEENKKDVKKYIRYLITNTDLSIITINSKINSLKIFLDKADLKRFKEIAIEDSRKSFKSISESREDTQYNTILFDVFSFFQYLLVHNEVEENPIERNILSKDVKYEYKYTRVDSYIVNQVFTNLDKVEEPYNIMYLLIYCVGLRASEVCLLKTNCLEKRSENHFIHSFNQKMQKYVSNVIPEALYALVKEYIEDNNFLTDYLFTGQYSDEEPMFASVLTDKLAESFKEFNIQTPKNETYKFKTHDYRHTLASTMLRADIPFQYIQRQLHHESPEMTFVYVEYDNLRKVEKIDGFINIVGEEVDLFNDDELKKDLSNAEWARKHINAQMLSNGVCGRPLKLGKCPHSNSCLTCKDFRTCKEFIEGHKEHLKQVENFIEVAKDNGWIPQIETNVKTKQTLELIIDTLEVTKDE